MKTSLTESARWLAVRALDVFDRTGVKPGTIIDELSRASPLKPNDHRLMANLFYGAIRNLRLLDYLIDGHLQKPGRLPKKVRNVLRIASFQLLYCDRIPDRAAVHTAVDLARSRSGEKMASLVNAVLRKVQSSGIDRKKLSIPGGQVTSMAIRYSFPDWMVAGWLKRFGRLETEQLLEAMNTHPPLNLRVNTILADRKTVARHLNEENFPCRPCGYSPEGLISLTDRPVESLDLFRRGLFSVQDEAFQLIGTLLPVNKGQLILDAFAGLGGKSTHLSQKSKGKALVTAADIKAHKLSGLVRECQRLGLKNILPVAADAMAPPFASNSFDAILLDVPCSGTGIIRRHPDIKWKREKSDIAILAAWQYRWIEAAAGLLKPGGHILYATCSLEPEENESVVMRFLEKYDTFRLVDLKEHHLPLELVASSGFFRSFPHLHGIDGATAALLERV